MPKAEAEACTRLVAQLGRRAWREALAKADAAAADVFAAGLERLLLAPPLRCMRLKPRSDSGSDSTSLFYQQYERVVCGVDPGIAHGHKCVVLGMGGAGSTGRLLAHFKLLPLNNNKNKNNNNNNNNNKNDKNDNNNNSNGKARFPFPYSTTQQSLLKATQPKKKNRYLNWRVRCAATK